MTLHLWKIEIGRRTLVQESLEVVEDDDGEVEECRRDRLPVKKDVLLE